MKHHTLWMLINIVILLVSVVVTWFIRPHDSQSEVFGVFFAQVSFILFLINANMYFIFLVIRKSPDRDVKKMFAALSRRVMRGHVPFAIVGTILILIHAGVMLQTAGVVLGLTHPKIVTGFTALGILAVTLFAGNLRRRRASGFRRKFHLVVALTFAAFMLLHLLTPITAKFF
ncbi:hypothetical protein [Brevibacillus sp. SYSU BS000544]|uniref:hypothetical protein n=1 Tax=Brevibacillus sp. SYSU BS000544 TaxID=3416443 RepID=UPI003CE56635